MTATTAAPPPVPGNGSAPALPATLAPAAPKLEIITIEQVEQQFLAVTGSDKATFDLVRRQYFSEVAKPETMVHVATMCREKGLDIHSKPFHVVTLDGKDYIWSSIGLYRTIAHRTGQYMGMSEPTYGPDKEFTFAGEKFTAPEWCQITVYRLNNGVSCPYPFRVYYEEQVVLKNGKPNAMWRKRPRGQQAKGAESGALRAGFPEVGETPTIEEMEGRELEYSAQSVHAAPVDEGTGEVLAKSHMSPQQKEEQIKKIINRPNVRGKQKGVAQPAADDAGTTQDESQAEQQAGEKEPTAPAPPAAAPAPPEPPPQETVDAEVVDDDPLVVPKEHLGALLQITRANEFPDAQVDVILRKKFGWVDDPNPNAISANMRVSQWKLACDWFAEHKPGDNWE